MNDRISGGPNGPEFRAWLRDNDPESVELKQEAIRVIEHLNEALAEPVRTRTTLEAALVDAMGRDVQQAKASAIYWQNEAQAQYNRLQEVYRELAEFKRNVKWWAIKAALAITGIAAVLLVVWVSTR